MGLTNRSTGRALADEKKYANRERLAKIALAGNPNVGKSTLFNALTGMNQHTGNWSGKTVGLAEGVSRIGVSPLLFIDVPGTYSLSAGSPEEEIARDILTSKEISAIAVVTDAACLERNLALTLQILELGRPTVLCVNLLDEAKRKGISVDLDLLSKRLEIPVVGMIARKKKGLRELIAVIEGTLISEETALGENKCPSDDYETAESDNSDKAAEKINLEAENFEKSSQEINLEAENFEKSAQKLQREAEDFIKRAEEICNGVCKSRKDDPHSVDRTLDRLFTGRKTAYPIMAALLLLIFWLTVVGANYPSEILSKLLFRLGGVIRKALTDIGFPGFWLRLLLDGAYTTLAWVVSVMLPPIAIFFPLFTILEDSGYLPRIAYNLDGPFCRCKGCGKQSLTMCMGFGCNAAGVVGCRIIDSPRERTVAILTNSLVPCNGRFPMLISIVAMFFVGIGGGLGRSLASAAMLTAIIFLSVAMTLSVSYLLSVTLLRGEKSAFILELPPYRPPEVGRILLRSLLDRTVFVLGRAVISAIPAGIILWLMANLHVCGTTPLAVASQFLDPFGRVLGLDGVILVAFILALPANEIVIPIIIMAYTQAGALTDLSSLYELQQLLISNGWTVSTALCVIIFSLFHWPCATTVLTVKKETGSLKWTLAAILIPTMIGIILCSAVNFIFKLLQF